jgi:signal transduction histidine kinase
MTERLAAVGRLAATVAHEINNPLEAVTNLVYLARTSSSFEQALGFLSQTEEQLAYVSHVTRQTLGFFRETSGARLVLPSDIVESILSVFGARAHNKGIALTHEVHNEVEIYAVPGEIRQVLTNLVSNSIDAIQGTGRIRIRIAATHRRGPKQERGVRITVADSGTGISTAILAHIFEPFFTTKRAVGTGLGLWICKSIIETHKGSIRVRSSSEPGKNGTVFSVFLPQNLEDAAANEEYEQQGSQLLRTA